MNAKRLTIAQMLESDGPGGAEMVVFDLSAELRSRGFEVVPVGPRDGVGWLGERFRNHGFEPEVYREGTPPDLRVASQLAEIFRRRGVDLVHSHEFTMSVYGAAACAFTRRPHVVTMHGNEGMTAALRRRVALRLAFRQCRSVIAVSQATRSALDADLGLRAGRVSVIHNGIPHRVGDPSPIRRELGMREGEVLIAAVGNLDPRKGHIHLLQALHELEGRISVPWRVAIAGGRGGPEKPRLLAFAAERGWSERVHVLTHRDDVPDLLAAADIFAMPSLWEGLPLALIEAMMAGTAIVASQTSGIPEAIGSEEHGLLVPPGDSSALANALGRLLEDEALRLRLAGCALERARAEFTIDAMTDAYERVYDEALGVHAD